MAIGWHSASAPAVADPPPAPAVSQGARVGGRIGALDGMRAVAVGAVIAYHLWPGALPAGFLGVDLFMVLSGFLITGILVDERARHGAIRLGAFWGRRFRRLVPALVALLAGVALWVHLAGPETLRPTVRSQGLAALLYVGNWKLVHDGVSYAALGSTPSPLLHLWSLAVEEQFYLVWPPVVAVVLLVSRGRRWPLALAASLGVVASATAMAVMFSPASDPLRLYYGTDTRAQTFLIGALTALAVRRGVGRRALRWAGPAALAMAVAAFVWAPPAGVLYRGGFACFALVAAVAVAAATVPGPVTGLLDRPGLRLIGRVSYGIYLWHWPVIVLLTARSTGLSGFALLATRAIVLGAATAASWVVIERPWSHLSFRPGALGGPIMVGAAASVLVWLPATQVAAYANVRVDRLPAPVVVTAPVAVAAPVVVDAAPPVSIAPPVATTLVTPGPGTVMIVGDSGTYDATPALSAGFGAAGWQVVSTAFPGIGLTSPTPVVRQMWAADVRRYHPTLIVVMLGGWDTAFIASHGDAAYRAVVEQTVGLLTVDGGRILWLSELPGGATPTRPQDRFFAPLAAEHPGVVDYFDIAPALTAPDGTWPRVVGGRLLRKPDAWHLCPDGASAVAHEVLGHLGIDRPGWDTGSWRTDKRYHDPPEGCPGS